MNWESLCLALDFKVTYVAPPMSTPKASEMVIEPVIRITKADARQAKSKVRKLFFMDATNSSTVRQSQ